VDHEIENHVHVGATLRERAEAVTLDEPRCLDNPVKGPNSPVEALYVSHLENPAALLCQIRQLFCLL
jgi:hypothetical protein